MADKVVHMRVKISNEDFIDVTLAIGYCYMEIMLELVMGVVNMQVDKVADKVADMVMDMEVDKVAYMVWDMD